MKSVSWGQRVSVVACLLLFSHSASAGLFNDEEARRAILELRQRVDALKLDRSELDRKLTEAAQRSSEEAQRSTEAAQRSSEETAQLTAQLTAQFKRSILDLQNQLEVNRAELAKLRGQNEQLARDVSEIQRRLRDASSTLEDRLRKLEPITVSVDGREFLADPVEKREFDANLALFRKGDYATATTGFVDFLGRYPQTGYRASALFWLGNAQYASKDCKSAIVNFRSLITQLPTHIHAPEALLTIANCQLEAKEAKGARKTLEELIAAYPGTDAANAAKDRLRRLK
ncbi:MAG: tol-pal system protein YbgF [Rhodoferax sp.]|nr:tol-pal system protein YbgF [Rhodoferax sp.]